MGSATDSAMGGGMNMGGAPVPTVTPGLAASIPTAKPDLSAFPVTVQSCGRTLTFAKPPERVVPLYPLTAEILLRLGLKDRIIATGLSAGDPPAPDLTAAFQQLPALSTDQPASKEVLLNARPDLVIDNFPSFFYNESQGLASIEQLSANGAQAYTLAARCDGNEATGKFADIYTDITSIGKIFGISADADKLANAIKQRAAAVQAAISGKPKLRVLIYDSGIGPINVYGPGAISDVVTQAGGENVFADQPREFAMLSAEVVASRDPEVFIITERQGQRGMSMGKELTSQEAADFLIKTFPNTVAAKNKRVVVIPYQQLYASLQNIDGVEALAKSFYPDAFASSAAGSYPVTIENCGKTLTFTKAPERILVTYQNVAEILVKLGLKDKIVGVTYGKAYPSPADMQAEIDGLNYLSPPGKGSAAKEIEFSTRPDIVIAAYPTYDFDPAQGMATQEDFAAAGAQVYGISAECATSVPGGTIETVYSDMLNFGKIFGVTPRAQAVVQGIKNRIATVQAKVGKLPPIPVAFYDAGEDQLGFYGSGLNSDMIALAGGANVFAGQSEVYLQVSKEAFAVKNPAIFAVLDYEGSNNAPDEIERANFLFKTFPNMPASKDKRWVAVPGSAFAAGIRIPEAIETMAKAFHPEAFK